ATLLAPMEIEMTGPRQGIWLQRIDDELSNIRFALRSATELGGGDAVSDGTLLASSLWRYWMFRGFIVTGVRWLRRMLDRAAEIDEGIRARATNNLGNLLFELDELDEALSKYQHSRELYDGVGDVDGAA